jgi:hypothetical protein
MTIDGFHELVTLVNHSDAVERRKASTEMLYPRLCIWYLLVVAGIRSCR